MAEDREDRTKSEPNGPERKIYIGAKGYRYIKVDELLKDPVFRSRLDSADRLAERLGLRRGKANGGSG